MKIAKYAIDRPVTTLMFYLAVVLLGVISLRQLSVDLMPKLINIFPLLRLIRSGHAGRLIYPTD